MCLLNVIHRLTRFGVRVTVFHLFAFEQQLGRVDLRVSAWNDGWSMLAETSMFQGVRGWRGGHGM